VNAIDAPTRRRTLDGWFCRAALGVLVATVALPVVAASVRQLAFAELCDRADLIIEGRVVTSDARNEGPGRGIRTYVRVEVLDRLKGPAAGTEIELRFAGGSIAGRTMSVGDMRIPAVGEVGLYFVESLDRTQIHPLVGWDQGHFLEQLDEATGAAGIYTPSGRAVLGIGADASRTQPRPVQSGHGMALEVEVAGAGGDSRQPMSVQAFKKRVREVLAVQAAKR
jgi:hypothetical protein